MPFAGAVTSSALLLLIFLWAEGQPVKGNMPKTGSVVMLGNNVTTTGAALMCYPKSVVDREFRLAKTVINEAPLAARFDAAMFLPGAVLLGSAPSPPMPPERRAPPPMPGDMRAPAAGASPEEKKGLSWRAKAWCGWALAVTLVIAVFVERPETFLVSPRIDPMFADDDEPIDGDGDGDVGEHLYCAICMETVPGNLKFSVGSCGHAFCSSCVAQYVAAKLGENLARVGCPDPGCSAGAVEPESCRGIISPDLLDKWGLLLCESAFGAKKVYCPYRECSAPLLADGEAGAAAIAEAECPHCHRLFCARCAVPWHAGIGCREFQQLRQDERSRDDLLLRGLAGRQRWQRCPKCQMYVEKLEGCNYIKCRCGYSFCYRCASKMSAQTHYCKKCKR